jgi:hypothetical protein
MEISGLHIQIIVSVVVIISAACLALLCDFLKARGEQLRENLVELRVQREEDERMKIMTAGGGELRAARARVLARALGYRKPEPDKNDATQVVTEWLTERSRSKAETCVELAAPSPVTISPIMEAFLADTLQWDSPLVPVPALELIQGAGSTELTVPSGMGDAAAFKRLLEDAKPFTGLIISIDVNNHDEAAASTLRDFIAGLLRETDFACRSSQDEFVIVCPGERGAQARRRLTEISERLWDFQLRTLGASSILFSWGGADVDREPFAQAVVVARERMYQTKRGRAKKAV